MAVNLVQNRIWASERAMDRMGVEDPTDEQNLIRSEQTDAALNPAAVQAQVSLYTALQSLGVVAFSRYLGYFFPTLVPVDPLFSQTMSLFGDPFVLQIDATQIVAMSVIGIATLINVPGVRLGGWVTNVFTLAKVLALLTIIVAVFSSGKGNSDNFMPWWPDHWSGDLTSAFGLAMISVLWSYEGWTTVTQSAGEIRNPERMSRSPF